MMNDEQQIQQEDYIKPLMVSTQEACEMLGLKDGRTIRRLIQDHTLEGKKMGNKWLITVRSLERFAFGDFNAQPTEDETDNKEDE